MPELHEAMADDDFDRAKARALLSRLRHFFAPERENLMSLGEIKELVRPRGETYRGMRAVDLADIVGSEGRHRDFNRHFLPKHDHLRNRWVKVDMAHYEDIPLPPVKLYEIGGVYFVRDGNHRVSVARSRGNVAIDAEVVSLDTEIRIEPGMTGDELRRKVIEYERELFEERTGYSRLTGESPPRFTEPGRYDTLVEHILVHKYYLNQARTGEMPLSEALLSWRASVYAPVVSVIRATGIASRFPERTEADIYVGVIKHWDGLKSSFGLRFPLEKAALDYAKKYGSPEKSTFRVKLRRHLRNIGFP